MHFFIIIGTLALLFMCTLLLILDTLALLFVFALFYDDWYKDSLIYSYTSFES